MSNMKRLALAALLATVSFAPGAAFAGGKAIAGIVFQQDQYFRGIQIGMEKAAEAAGDELLAGNSDSKLEKEAQLIDTYIARGVNSIVVAPLSADASVPALKKARDAGITVVTYGTSANGDVAQATVTKLGPRYRHRHRQRRNRLPEDPRQWWQGQDRHARLQGTAA